MVVERLISEPPNQWSLEHLADRPILGDNEPGLLQQEGVHSQVGAYLNDGIGKNHGHSLN